VIRRIWSVQENEALIADYFSMLKDELRNERINKAAHLRANDHLTGSDAHLVF